MNILVLGSSASAISFVDTYRKKNKEDQITIFTPESINPYFRPMLSHMLGVQELPTGFFIKKEEFYSENNIRINHEEKAISINCSDNKITTNKNTYSYDKLIIAIGSNNFIPPVKGVELKNVCNLKFYNDLTNINKQLSNVERITVIGGGLLGIEAAWSLAKAGKKVNILEFSNKIMAKQMDVAASKFISDELEKSGIEVNMNVSVVEINGNEVVKSYKLNDGSEHKTDMILYSVGVRPNISMLKNCGIEVNQGIIVDENYLTSEKNIYALGDIAELNSIVNGTWTSAIGSGKIAALHLLDEEVSKSSSLQLPVILKAMNIDVTSIGIIDEELGLKAEVTSEKYIRYFIKDDILVGAIVIGNKKLATKLGSMINKPFNIKIN